MIKENIMKTKIAIIASLVMSSSAFAVSDLDEMLMRYDTHSNYDNFVDQMISGGTNNDVIINQYSGLNEGHKALVYVEDSSNNSISGGNGFQVTQKDGAYYQGNNQAQIVAYNVSESDFKIYQLGGNNKAYITTAEGGTYVDNDVRINQKYTGHNTANVSMSGVSKYNDVHIDVVGGGANNTTNVTLDNAIHNDVDIDTKAAWSNTIDVKVLGGEYNEAKVSVTGYSFDNDIYVTQVDDDSIANVSVSGGSAHNNVYLTQTSGDTAYVTVKGSSFNNNVVVNQY